MSPFILVTSFGLSVLVRALPRLAPISGHKNKAAKKRMLRQILCLAGVCNAQCAMHSNAL